MATSLTETSSFLPDGTINIFTSAYKDLRFNTLIRKYITVTEDMASNLFGISYNEYGTIDLWRILLYANGLQCPINDVTVGTVLAIPDLTAIQAYLSRQTNRFSPITI